MRRISCALWFAVVVSAQAPVASQFEAASLKPSGPLQRPYPARTITGGPGTTGPGQITYREHSLKDLIFQAYRVQSYQISTPGWMESSYFDIVATVPAGATRDDLRTMLQHLLRERFALQTHSETRQMAGYALLLGDGAHKMTPSASPSTQADSALPPKLEVDKEGFVIPPPGVPNIFYLPPKEGVARLTAAHASISMFCSYLRRLLQQPVTDETGLQGSFDFRLKFAPETAALPDAGDEADPTTLPASDPAPTLTRAVAGQLGLKLLRKRVPVDVLVIDHCERTPVEN
jgi:uncharacterized protein (TIGR03435 family)